MVDDLKEYAESVYTDARICRASAASIPIARPFTKESLLYREIFEKYYPGQAEMIAGLLDAQQGLAGLRRRRPQRPRAVQLRCQRRVKKG